MRTFNVRRTVLAATVMTAALVTTACGATGTSNAPSAEGSGKGPSAASTVAPSSSSGQSGTGATDSGGKQTAGGTDSGTSAGTNGGTSTDGKQTTGGTKKPDGGQAKVVTCTGDNTRVVVNRPARPINHLLLTATNKGSASCDLYRAPLLRFDDEQSATAIDDGTQQQSVIRLAPGESAYASVILMGERTGEEANGRTTARLGVHFDSRDASGSVGRPAILTLPADTYKTDDAKVTHWLNNLDEALSY
ncbi:DUF4232 domain-containing protein [Streptomyces sp. NBC_01353]|uniref:DUF4232 domain-containing protein n=1 Tax=Streptomyces sp. NBC_01353 TaxID=2903835 RepID=UPI002E2F5026|nr:DUF4232 domain-containing protein [Streptomyces sp. NBC_01353]